MSWLLAITMGSVMGLSLGLFGSGGSVMTVPILIYVLGYETKSAMAMSLAIVGLTAAAGTARQWKKGNLCPKAALFFSGVGIAGTLFGAWVALKIPDRVQLLLFGFLVLAMSLLLLGKKDRAEESGRDECAMRPDLAGGLGAGAGFLTGLLGVGGGFVIVPALHTVGHLKLRLAIGTSLLVIAVNSVAGVAAYWHKVSFDWPLVFLFAAVSSLAGMAGVALSHKLRVETLRKGFAVFLLVLGGWIVGRNLLLPT